MKFRSGSLLGPLRHLGRKFWVSFVSACVIAFFLEAGFDRLVESADLPGITQSIFNLSGLYQQILTAPRIPVPRYTAIVEINANPQAPQVVPMTNICGQRIMMTKLLDKVAQALPNVIVIDKYYEPNPCPGDGDLISEINDLRGRGIRVVVGRRASDEGVEERSGVRYYLLRSICFGNSDPCLQGSGLERQLYVEGVVNIDPDTRKLPLEWTLFASKEDAQIDRNRNLHETLALSAARAYDDQLIAHHPRLAHFVDVGQHPYVSFIRPGDKGRDFERMQVQDILPLAPDDKQPSGQQKKAGGNKGREILPFKTQPDAKLLGELQRKLSGKIVLIGEINTDVDSHPSVVGQMSGLDLQANYIEALLDDRYFRPAPILDYVLGFVILAFLELIVIVFRHSWLKIGLLTVALFVAAAASLVLMVNLPHWYVNPSLVGALAVFIRLLHVLFVPAERVAET
jgi:hypothetical protein